MNNNELNNQETGVFNMGNTPNNELNNQTFTDDSLNNFGQAPINSTTNVDLSSQTIQTEPVDTIFTNDQSQEVITPSVTQPVNNVAQNLNSSEPVNNIVEEPKVSEPVMDSKESRQKKSKGPVVIIIFLILIILGLAGYIVYDKYLNKDTKEPETKEEEKNTLTKVKDTTLIEELRSGLIAPNKVNSLYYSNIKATDANNKNLIGYNVVKYIGDNNIPLNTTDAVYKDSGYKLNLTISKTDINDYINNKYNTNLDYSYTSKDNNDVLANIGCSAVLSDETNYYYVTMTTGCGQTKINTKLVKAEEDNNYVYIYDKYVRCSSDAGWTGCGLTEDEQLGTNSTISCTEESPVDEKCPIKGTVEQLSEYAINNMTDSLKTFKHTFKKLDGNYFWVSSEVVE